MKLYAYCVSDELTPGMLASVTGIGGAPVYVVQSEDIAALVSDIEVERIEVTRENVLEHERAVRALLAETTPLPFRFGALVTEKELRSYLTTHNESLKAQLNHVRGCVEMSVKVIWDVEAIREEVGQMGSQTEAGREKDQTANGIGTAFLAAKRREVHGDNLLEKRAAELAAWLEQRLGDSIRESRANIQPAQSLVLAVAHLVERGRLEDYRAALLSARSERNELHFLTSGAWPPYSFTIINS